MAHVVSRIPFTFERWWVRFSAGFALGLLPCIFPPLFPQALNMVPLATAVLAAMSAGFAFRAEGSRVLIWIVFVFGLTAATIFYSFFVVHIRTAEGVVAVPVGFTRRPVCCRELDNVTCLSRRLSLEEGAIRWCWGQSVVVVRLSLVVSWALAAVSGGRLLGLLGERSAAAQEKSSKTSEWDLFISYAHEDSAFVERLVHDLVDHGVSVWRDTGELKVGEMVAIRIREGLPSCSCYAVILSPEAVISRWVRRELKAALSIERLRGIRFILPVLHRPCEIPTSLRGRVWADFTAGYEEGFSAFLDGIPLVEAEATKSKS